MRLHRPMSGENIRPLLLFSVIMVVLSLLPMLSHAAVFWDDELEPGNTGTSEAYINSTLIPKGIMSYDTSVKFSGKGSIRLNFPAKCLTRELTNAQCGGSITRSFPPTEEQWKRVYFRMSGSGPNPTDTGLFKTSLLAFTKLLKGQSDTIDGFTSRHWWTMGCCESKTFMQTQENVPSPGRATNMFSSITFQDNRWYCIETHEKMNTPGQPDGISEAWVDGVKMVGRTDVIWRQAGIFGKWKEFSMIRQEGQGNIWFDRLAAGNTRIGCLGGSSASDTTPPAPPQGLVIR